MVDRRILPPEFSIRTRSIPMQRRSLLAATGAALAAPSAVRAQSATTLKFTPQQDLITLDPVTTTAYISRNHGYMVFDTLYGMDGNYQAVPQMVSGTPSRTTASCGTSRCATA
jgi:ABC-type transport system substrate-binding protein